MAFGDLKVALNSAAASMGTSLVLSTGGTAVAVGDLVYAVLAEQGTITSTACNDNLGNTYTAASAGLDAGTTVTARAWYSRVTVPGTLSTVTFTANGGTSDAVGLAAVIEGPFTSAPVDTNPTGIINDNTTPYLCPATGTLAQAAEVVMCFAVQTGNVTLTATSPNTKSIQFNSSTIFTAAIGRQLVAATTSVAPAWTSSATPTESAYGTLSFKRAATQTLTPGIYNETDTFFAPSIRVTLFPAYSLSSPLYRYRTVLASEVIMSLGKVIPSTVLSPGQIADADAFFAPGVGIAPPTIAFSEATPLYRYRLVPVGEAITTFYKVTPQFLSPNAFSDTDSFFSPTVGGFIVPSVFTDTDAFSAPVISVSFTILPGLLADSDTFFAQSMPGLTPALFVDSDTVFVPDVARGVVGLTPSAFTDSDAFFGPSIVLPSITPTLFSDSDVFFAAGIVSTYNLDLGRITDVDSFSAPGLTAGTSIIQPSVFTDADAFYVPAIDTTAQITPTIFADSETFYTPNVVGGGIIPTVENSYGESTPLNIRDIFIPPMSVTVVIRKEVGQVITPNMFADADSYRTPAVAGGLPVARSFVSYAETSPLVVYRRFIPPMSVMEGTGRPPARNLTPGPITDTDNFFVPNLIRGTVNVAPVLFTDVDVLFSPAVASAGGTQALTAVMFTDVDAFFAPAAITVGAVNIDPARFTDADTFFAPTLGITVLPSLFADADSFFAPGLTNTASITPALFSEADTFFVPQTVPGAVILSLSRFTDTDAFFAPSISVGVITTPSKFTDSDTFFAPVVLSGGVTPELFVDPDSFFVPRLFGDEQHLVAGSFVDQDRFFVPGIIADPSYDYPIGHSLSSDYGIRKSRLRRGGRYIIGRR